jgi:hypothetical protein
MSSLPQKAETIMISALSHASTVLEDYIKNGQRNLGLFISPDEKKVSYRLTKHMRDGAKPIAFNKFRFARTDLYNFILTELPDFVAEMKKKCRDTGFILYEDDNHGFIMSPIPAPVSAKAAVVPAKAAVVPAKAEVVPAKAEVVSAKAAVVPAKAAVVPAKAEVVPAKAEVVPAKAEVVPAKAAVVPAKAEVVPAKAEVVPAKAEVGPAKAEVVPAKAEVVPAKAEVVPAKAEVVPAKAEVVPVSVKAEVVPAKAEVVPVSVKAEVVPLTVPETVISDSDCANTKRNLEFTASQFTPNASTRDETVTASPETSVSGEDNISDECHAIDPATDKIRELEYRIHMLEQHINGLYDGQRHMFMHLNPPRWGTRPPQH